MLVRINWQILSLLLFLQIKYIQPFPGQSISMDPSAVIDVCGIIGTPSLWKQHAALVWRVGPTYLFEEVLSSDQVETIYGQGTKYIGNYLALNAQGEKVCFSRSKNCSEFNGNLYSHKYMC